ncbi:MAG: hypothetical protein ACR2P4_04290 [Gammaproteobacteria bacterium]
MILQDSPKMPFSAKPAKFRHSRKSGNLLNHRRASGDIIKALKGRPKTTAANVKRAGRPYRAMDIKAPTLAGAALLLCNNATDYR